MINNQEDKIKLKKAILKTIVFFDIFDYPLTARELWRKIDKRVDFGDFCIFLESLDFRIIDKKDAYYFLQGRENIIEKRQKKYNYTCAKYKKTFKYARIFSLFSGVSMIAVGNVIGNNNLEKDGDIDIFVIAAKGSVWRVRFYLTIISKLLGLRPTPKNKKDKFCLNFFVDKSFADLEGLKIRNDIYFDHWMEGLFPIYNKNWSYEKFMEKNLWLKKVMPNWSIRSRSYKYLREKRNIIIGLMLDLFFLPGEFIFRQLQLRFLPSRLKEQMNRDTGVVVRDNILKLHSCDNREKYLDIFHQKIKSFYS